eukprot:CAMPEP_0180130506 /NCGR_PEP_ID=MMETSP0986-20121125/7906_1 /TAXON_ID=697907 /ORGANISM="non described non described, Strain CCMP2293" /LENGTH=85 /DNA_ID=CAMNT_0022070287 /DNA_START=22 /DNA_END=280 /DNA_ORIENTATION=-
MGYEHHEQRPIAMGAKKMAPAEAQQLWMFNMGYEHHEQRPIAMGAKKTAPVVVERWEDIDDLSRRVGPAEWTALSGSLSRKASDV